MEVPHYWTADQVGRLLDALAAHNRHQARTAALIMWRTGLRVGEVLELEWRDLAYWGRPAPGGAANQGDGGGLARRTLAGAGRWREASGRAREAQFRLSKIGSAAAGPEGDSAAQEVKKWCLGRSRLAGGARALIFNWRNCASCWRLGFSYSKTGKWHNCASWVAQKCECGRGHFGGAVALFLGLIGLPPGGALSDL